MVFCGTFTNDAKLEIRDGKLHIVREGKVKKFVRQVEQITFSGKYARKIGQPVYYVTERAVFMLTGEGMTLVEIAPGLDVEKDILAAMDFTPIISPDLREMPSVLFQEIWGGLRAYVESAP